MKLGQVTKIDKRRKTKSKTFGDDVMVKNCDGLANFQIYSQVSAVWNPDSGRIFCKSYIFTNSNLLSYKNQKQN